MLYRYALPRQPTIKSLLFRRQRVFFTLFKRYLAVGMIRCNPLITTVHLDQNLRTHRSARAALVKSKIMNTTWCLGNKKNDERVQINHHLRLYSMTLLLA